MNNFNKLSDDELHVINGGGAVGALAGAMLSFPVGLIGGAVGMIVDGNSNPNILWKTTVAVTLSGTAVGMCFPI